MDFPSVVTIFSAPNYCGSYDNKGAYFFLDHGSVRVKQYNPTEAPYQLPNGLNVFTWSAPFLADRIVNMFVNLLKQGENSQIEYNNDGIFFDDDDEDEIDIKHQKHEVDRVIH